jgi:hypothetical protein
MVSAGVLASNWQIWVEQRDLMNIGPDEMAHAKKRPPECDRFWP